MLGRERLKPVAADGIVDSPNGEEIDDVEEDTLNHLVAAETHDSALQPGRKYSFNQWFNVNLHFASDDDSRTVK